MNIEIYKERSQLDHRLVSAVLDQLEAEDSVTLEDISNHGVAGGFTGFIYTYEIIEFFEVNRPLILDQLKEDIKSMSENSILEFVKTFSCLPSEVTTDDIGVTLWSDDLASDEMVAVCLAQYAAETVAKDYISCTQE